MAGDFGGEVAGFYARFRRGYQPAFVELLARALRLGSDDVIMDLGCGTGQLTLPLAGRVRAAVGVDPEPDMLVLARQAAQDQGVTNVTWVLGADHSLPSVGTLLGARTLSALTIANAIHLVPYRELFAAAATLLKPGAGIAVIANGTPLWQQPTAWSRALRHSLEQWLGTRLESRCGTDTQSRQLYRDALETAGFTGVHEQALDYTGHLDFSQLVGGVCSAMPASLLPAQDQRAAFAGHIRAFTGPGPRFTEQVHVAALIGYTPAPAGG